jgi:hypothetical protein
VTIAVIGAAPANLAAISSAASGVQVRDGSVGGASWVIVATAVQRREAAARSGLPAFRIVHVPGLDREGGVEASVLVEGLVRMREIGPYAAEPSTAAVTVTRWLMPWIRPALERWLGQRGATIDAKLSKKADVNAREAAVRAEEAARRVSLERAGLVSPITPEQARERVERKAQRKAARRAREPLVSDAPAKRPS